MSDVPKTMDAAEGEVVPLQQTPPQQEETQEVATQEQELVKEEANPEEARVENEQQVVEEEDKVNPEEAMVDGGNEKQAEEAEKEEIEAEVEVEAEAEEEKPTSQEAEEKAAAEEEEEEEEREVEEAGKQAEPEEGAAATEAEDAAEAAGEPVQPEGMKAGRSPRRRVRSGSAVRHPGLARVALAVEMQDTTDAPIVTASQGTKCAMVRTDAQVFTFDHALSADSAMDTLGRRALDAAFAGTSVCLVGCGPSGLAGLVPEVCAELFKEVEALAAGNESLRFRVSLQAVAITDERIDDLLLEKDLWPTVGHRPRPTKGGGYALDTVAVPCANFAEAQQCLDKAAAAVASRTATVVHVLLFESVAPRFENDPSPVVFSANIAMADVLCPAGRDASAFANAVRAVLGGERPRYTQAKLTLLLHDALASGQVLVYAKVPSSKNKLESSLALLKYLDKMKPLRPYSPGRATSKARAPSTSPKRPVHGMMSSSVSLPRAAAAPHRIGKVRVVTTVSAVGPKTSHGVQVGANGVVSLPRASNKKAVDKRFDAVQDVSETLRTALASGAGNICLVVVGGSARVPCTGWPEVLEEAGAETASAVEVFCEAANDLFSPREEWPDGGHLPILCGSHSAPEYLFRTQKRPFSRDCLREAWEARTVSLAEQPGHLVFTFDLPSGRRVAVVELAVPVSPEVTTTPEAVKAAHASAVAAAALKLTLRTLADGKKTSFKETKLTLLLQDLVLSTRPSPCTFLLHAAVSTSAADVEQTMAALRYLDGCCRPMAAPPSRPVPSPTASKRSSAVPTFRSSASARKKSAGRKVKKTTRAAAGC